MKYISRQIEPQLVKVIKQFPVLSVTGPRQSGKTTLLKNVFPDLKYFNLERIDLRNIVISDPMGFLKSTGTGVIFDEAQNFPELFSYIQVISDERGTPGQYILSGSQSFLLNQHISQSLAGRVHISNLLPFSMKELSGFSEDICHTLHKGFYPRIYSEGITAGDFYPSYLQTYIERDVRSIKSIENLNSFSRFLGLCAGRVGQILNLSSLANDAGVSVNTAKAWLSILEAGFIIFLMPPFYKNYNKRLIKSPKIYFYDTGIVCSLLRITNPDMLKTHYLFGSLFENLIIDEILKSQINSGNRPEAYYWRESNGTEIDCILEKGNGDLIATEIKAGETFNKDYLKNFKNFPGDANRVIKYIIYTGDQSTDITNVRLISYKDMSDFLEEFNR